MNSVVITGVSTGIGYGAAAELCRRGYRVFGTVRSEIDAQRLQHDLGKTFTPLVLDVTDGAAVKHAAAQVEAALAGEGLFGLVNNAGISDPGPLSLVPVEVFRQHLEVNVIGALQMVQAFLPLLRAAKRVQSRSGRIVNVSSLSGRIAYPFMGAYTASKHALEAMSDSLRRELLIYGVDVIVIQPGNVDTPIWTKASHVGDTYKTSDYARVLARLDLPGEGRKALPVIAISRRIVRALTATRPKARYVVPDQWFKFWLVPRLLPDRWLDRAIDHVLRFQEIRNDLK